MSRKGRGRRGRRNWHKVHEDRIRSSRVTLAMVRRSLRYNRAPGDAGYVPPEHRR